MDWFIQFPVILSEKLWLLSTTKWCGGTEDHSKKCQICRLPVGPSLKQSAFLTVMTACGSVPDGFFYTSKMANGTQFEVWNTGPRTSVYSERERRPKVAFGLRKILC